jgi:hypothetical protein
MTPGAPKSLNILEPPTYVYSTNVLTNDADSNSQTVPDTFLKVTNKELSTRRPVIWFFIIHNWRHQL